MNKAVEKKGVMYGLLSLNALTIFGNTMTEIAIPWLILEISNSPAMVATIMTAKVLPIIFASFFSAIVVDRFGQFRISIISDLVNFISVLLIPLFYQVDMLSFSLLALLVMVSTMFDSPSMLSKDVILSREMSANNFSKEQRAQINSMNSTVESLCDFTSPLLVTLIIPILGTVGALYFDAVTFLLTAIGLIVLRKYLSNPHEHINKQNLPSWQFFVTGLRYLHKNKLLGSILLMSAMVNMVITPLLQVYLPVIAKNTFESVMSLGILMTSFALGTIFSKVLYASIVNRVERTISDKQLMIAGYVLLAITLASMNFATTYLVNPEVLSIYWQGLLYIQLFLVGLSIGFSAPIEVTLIQTKVPELLFTRIMTLFTSVRFLAVPFGYLCFGWLLESHYASWTPLLMAVFVTIGLMVFIRVNRHYS